MGLRIDKKRARRQLARALRLARSDAAAPADWIACTERVAQFEDKTWRVVLGAALLATAADDAVDALTLKARAGNKAYSDRVDAMPRVKHPEEMRYLVECLEAAHYLREDEAVQALAAFLRQRIAAKEQAAPIDLGHTRADLVRLKDACGNFLDRSAESGKRAQALVAAAFDLVFDDVRTARVFDPSRKLPGDVQAFHKLEPVVAVEVRAKPVTYSDAMHFVRSVAAAGFPHAMIAGLDAVDSKVLHLSKEAWQETGVLVTVYTQFSDILLDALAWSRRPLHQLLAEFPKDVVARLTQLEVKTSSMALWGELVS